MRFPFLKSSPKPIATIVVPPNTDKPLDPWFLPQNGMALKQLYLYSMIEFSAENILGMLAVKSYQKNPSKSLLGFVTSTFLDPSSPYEVNVPNPVRTNLQTQLDAFYRGPQGVFDARTSARSNAKPPANILDALESAMVGNIADTLARFQPAYAPSAPRNPSMRQIMPFDTVLQAQINAQMSKYRGALTMLRGMQVEVPGAFATLS